MLKTKFKMQYLINIALAILSIILVIRYQYHLLAYLEWEDEVTHIISSKLIVSGLRLYSEIYELHGPLTLLSGILLELILPASDVATHRIPIAILQWCALFSLFYSPIIKACSYWTRLIYCIGVATFINVYLSDIFGHTYLFQNISGYFIIIILALYTLPSLYYKKDLSKNAVIIGNVLIGALPFLAFTYIPISIALFFCSIRKEFARTAVLSFIFSIAFNIFFLAYIGSIPGYAAMHFWNNLFITREFVDGSTLGASFLAKAIWSSITNDASRYGVFCMVIASIACIPLAAGTKSLFRIALLSLGIMSLLVRASGFQGLTFLYVFLAMLMVPLSAINLTNGKEYLLTPILAIGLLKLYFLSPANIPERQIRQSSQFSVLAKEITSGKDKIISWPFQNMEYLLSNRLPASGNFFYSPWQAKYYQNPILGIEINSCNELYSEKPKIMLVTKYSMSNIPWEKYTPLCFQNLLINDYILIPKTSIYLRRDIAKSYKNIN